MHISRHQFTLIELLVVITIITVLASLLLPALERGKDMARTIACANNLKQQGITMNFYADDFRGYIPPIRFDNTADTIHGDFISAVAGGEYGGYGTPMTAFQGYEQGDPISQWGSTGNKEGPYFCPSDLNPNNTPDNTSRKRVSYGVSLYFYFLNDRNNRFGNDYRYNKAFNLTRLKKPSESAYMSDCDDASLNDFVGNNMTGDTFTGSLATDSYGQLHFTNLVFRHNSSKSANFMFVDGHVAKYTLPILPYSLSGAWCNEN